MRKPALLPAILAAFLGGVAGRTAISSEIAGGCPEGVFPLWLNRDFEKVRIKLATYKSLFDFIKSKLFMGRRDKGMIANLYHYLYYLIIISFRQEYFFICEVLFNFFNNRYMLPKYTPYTQYTSYTHFLLIRHFYDENIMIFSYFLELKKDRDNLSSWLFSKTFPKRREGAAIAFSFGKGEMYG